MSQHVPESEPLSAPSGDPFPIIGLGASAGGVEALQAFVAALPADANSSVVVVLHLPGDLPSELHRLLDRQSALPVRRIESGVPLERGVVYVLPPGSSVTLEAGRLQLSERPPERYWRPVDQLFASLAAEAGERAVALVLSGTGTNGSPYLGEVKAAGGLVLAQDPAEAAFPEMPRQAIATGYVEECAPCAELARLVADWGRRLPRLGDLAECEAEQLAQALSLIREHTGRDFRNYKRGTVERRIQRRVGMRDCESAAEYLRLLSEDPGEVERLAQDLLIGVTGFFRDGVTWAVLAERVLPALLDEREDDEPLRAWIAGCASGEEAYTLAILLTEELARRGRRRPVQIFATDVDHAACERARRGLFPAAALERLDERRRAEYFSREDGHYRITQPIRDMITFAQHDLLRDPPFSQLDLVSCRNVLIYLDGEAQAEVLATFHFALRRDGVLLLGGSETVQRQDGLFTAIEEAHRCYRRRDTPTPSPAFGGRHRMRHAGPAPIPSRAQGWSRGQRDHHHLAQDLAQRYLAPAFVLVDDQGRICYFSGPTENFLHQPQGAPNDRLIEICEPHLRPRLTAALSHAGGHDEPVVLTYASAAGNRGGIPVEVTVQPVRGNDGERLWLVSFRRRLGPPASAAAEAVVAGELEPDQALHALDQELRATREELSSSIEELETSNEELKASNEEVRSMYEELQSANEELQAVNEELGIVNRQLQSKVGELGETKDVLANLLCSTNLPTVFLDRELHIKRFTPAAGRLFKLIEGDLDRPFADFADRVSDGRLLVDAHQVLETLVPTERELRAEDDGWYLLRVHPYRTADDRIEGVVATLSEVGELKRVQEELRASEARYRSIFDNAAVGIAGIDRRAMLRTSNHTFGQITGIPNHLLADRPLTAFLEEGPGRELAAALERVAGDGSEAIELPLRVDGGRRWLRWTLSATHTTDADDVIAIVENVTERHEAERALHRRREELERSNDDLSHFAAMASHDLQAPLRLIGSHLDLIRELGDELAAETRERYFRTAQENVHHMRAMITDMLAYAHCELAERKVELCDSGEALRTALGNIGGALEERGADVSIGELPEVVAPSRLLIQLFQNLVDNASKYGREGLRPRVVIAAERGSREWIFSVADNGRGIPADLQDQIFELFDRSGSGSERGTGIGLAICRKGVERLGGRIWVESEPEVGSTFFFSVPESLPAHGGEGDRASG